MDDNPVRTFEESWNAVEVSGRVNLAALLGLPACDPVNEVTQLMAEWDAWAAYWGPEPATFKAGSERPFLQIYKIGDALNKQGFAWCGEGVDPAVNDRFAAALAGDPLLAEWVAGVQRGLAKQRLGPHGWVSISALDILGNESHRQLFFRKTKEPTEETPAAALPTDLNKRRPGM
jgi:hypothetical protein